MKQSEHDVKLRPQRLILEIIFQFFSKSLLFTEKVSYINGEPVELLSDMLAKRARSGTSTEPRNFKNNAVLSSICEKVAKGDLDDDHMDEESASEGKDTAPRKGRTSIAGVWTRPQALSIDSVITSPRVLWEVDTPTDFSTDDESLENFSELVDTFEFPPFSYIAIRTCPS